MRTTATVGGNLCNALPSADMAPVLLALDATCYIADIDSQESLPLTDFFVGPRLTVLEDRLLVGVALPGECAGWRCASHKLTRSAEDISLVQVAVALGVDDDKVRTPGSPWAPWLRCPCGPTLAEAMLTGLEDHGRHARRHRAMRRIWPPANANPSDDHRASAEYRRDMVQVLTRRLVTGLLAEDRR